jgi:hypothetical protein
MKIWMACVCSLWCATVWSQSTGSAGKKERLDAVVKSYTAGNSFMGAVLVVEGGYTLLDKGYGMADMEWNIPNRPEAKFRLGSITKQFTATLILLLQQDGKLHKQIPTRCAKELGEDHAGESVRAHVRNSRLHDFQGVRDMGDESTHACGGDLLLS